MECFHSWWDLLIDLRAAPSALPWSPVHLFLIFNLNFPVPVLYHSLTAAASFTCPLDTTAKGKGMKDKGRDERSGVHIPTLLARKKAGEAEQLFQCHAETPWLAAEPRSPIPFLVPFPQKHPFFWGRCFHRRRRVSSNSGKIMSPLHGCLLISMASRETAGVEIAQLFGPFSNSNYVEGKASFRHLREWDYAVDVHSVGFYF